MINEAVRDVRIRAAYLPRPNLFQRKAQTALPKKRFGSLLLYTVATFGLAVFCTFMFNLMEHDAEFAISVIGSLIGGFLGALLAAALIIDIYFRPAENNEK